MLMSMKSIALIWDYSSGHLKEWPTIIEYLGYMMCAGCTQFGPYISYKQYLNAYHPSSTIHFWVPSIIYTIILLYHFYTTFLKAYYVMNFYIKSTT